MDQQNQNSSELVLTADLPKGNYGLLILAHELRNPISCAVHAAQILRESDRLVDPEAHRWAIAAIERQVGRIASIVDDIRQTSPLLMPVRLEPASVDVATVIDHALESARPLIETHRHVLKSKYQHGKMWLRVDARQLEQVLVNLLTNAVAIYA